MQIYSIRQADQEELGLLPDVERAAAAMFRKSPYPALADGPLAANSLLPDDVVWIVVAGESIVGFAIARKTGAAIHIQEIDVHPAHARRGLGRQLIDRIVQWARESGYRAITLTTFADVPWNGPYYLRLGFAIVSPGSMTAELRAILTAEEAAGLPMAQRICMQMLL